MVQIHATMLFYKADKDLAGHAVCQKHWYAVMTHSPVFGQSRQTTAPYHCTTWYLWLVCIFSWYAVETIMFVGMLWAAPAKVSAVCEPRNSWQWSTRLWFLNICLMLSVNGYHKDGCRQQGCFVGLNTCLHILGYLLLPLLQPFCTCMCVLVSAFKPLHPKLQIFHSTFMERGPDKEKGVKSSFCCVLAVVYSIDTMSERKKNHHQNQHQTPVFAGQTIA